MPCLDGALSACMPHHDHAAAVCMSRADCRAGPVRVAIMVPRDVRGGIRCMRLVREVREAKLNSRLKA